MNSRRKRLHDILQTADRCGLCKASIHNLQRLYCKKVPEEDRPGILEALLPDARAVHERFLREEQAQKDEKAATLAGKVAMDRMMGQAGDKIGPTSGEGGDAEGGDVQDSEEEDGYEDVEMDREYGGVVLATDM